MRLEDSATREGRKWMESGRCLRLPPPWYFPLPDKGMCFFPFFFQIFFQYLSTSKQHPFEPLGIFCLAVSYIIFWEDARLWTCPFRSFSPLSLVPFKLPVYKMTNTCSFCWDKTPSTQDHHLLLVTLLLFNTVANEVATDISIEESKW